MPTDWLKTGTGAALLREESRRVAGSFENIFGDHFLQIGAWGPPNAFRRYARTRRYAVVAAERGPGVDFVSAPEELAVATDSIDAVFLPHVLEFAEDPHAVLREVDRILRADGHVVIAGFNAWGWWGLRHHLSGGRFPAGGQRMVSEYRIRDWLNLLEFSVQPTCFHFVAAPLYRRFRAGESAAGEPDDVPVERHDLISHPQRWNPLASCYLTVARREVLTLTRVRPAFRRRAQLVGGLVNPTTRNIA